MKKIILVILAMLTVLTLSASAFSIPKLEYMFYDIFGKTLYTYGSYNKTDSVLKDAGIYFNGIKYGLVTDETGTENLEKYKASDDNRFGIGLIASKSHFLNVTFIPFVTLENGKEILGEPVLYNETENSVEKTDAMFFENFTTVDEGELPSTLIFKNYAGASSTTVKYKTEDGNEKNMLKLVDESTGNAAYSTLLLPEYQDSIVFEIRIKLEKTTTDGFGFIIDFFDDSETAFRIIKFADSPSDSFCYVSNNLYSLSGGNVNLDGEWLTLKVKIDNYLSQSRVMFISDLFGEGIPEISETPFIWHNPATNTILSYNLMWYNEYSGDKINKITMSTYGKSCGEYYIDYIRIYEAYESFEPIRTRAPGKYIKKIPDPVPRK